MGKRNDFWKLRRRRGWGYLGVFFSQFLGILGVFGGPLFNYLWVRLVNGQREIRCLRESLRYHF